MTRSVAPGLSLLALLYINAARGFDSGFVADPIGPRAFPYGIGFLLAATALAAAWSALPADGAPPRLNAAQAGFLAALVMYTMIMPIVGFVLATTMFTATLVSLFHGPLFRAAALGLVLSVAIFVVFTFVLAIPLP